MFLEKLTLTNFKNHPHLSLNFTKKLNCFIGFNGVGKTNALDAIHYICLTKSNFNAVDQQQITFGQDFFRLDALFSSEKDSGVQNTVICKFQAGKKKDFTVNDVPYKKLSQHIGRFPLIFITPDDNELITGGSEERRRFLDNMISQVDEGYLEDLILYNKYLAQRNAALKIFAESGKVDTVLLESYNDKLMEHGQRIHAARTHAIVDLQGLFQSYYALISGHRERVAFQYQSQFNSLGLVDLIPVILSRELALQRSEWGIHKDDIEFVLNGNRIKKFGSQGQQKSFIISLKLAQYAFIKKKKNFAPLLLIDDLFDKLDGERSAALIRLIMGPDFGQVFISDTKAWELVEVLKNREAELQVFPF